MRTSTKRQDGPDLWEDFATFEQARNCAEPRRRDCLRRRMLSGYGPLSTECQAVGAVRTASFEAIVTSAGRDPAFILRMT